MSVDCVPVATHTGRATLQGKGASTRHIIGSVVDTDPDPYPYGSAGSWNRMSDPHPHKSGQLRPDPDPHQSEKVETLEGNFGASRRVQSER